LHRAKYNPGPNAKISVKIKQENCCENRHPSIANFKRLFSLFVFMLHFITDAQQERRSQLIQVTMKKSLIFSLVLFLTSNRIHCFNSTNLYYYDYHLFYQNCIECRFECFDGIQTNAMAVACH
jgi:hypothetical protein